MCIIIDANLAGDVFSISTPDDFAPLIHWIENGGKVVFGGGNGRELGRIILAAKRLQEWKRSGMAEEILDVDKEESRVINTLSYKSNDPHIIALARLSGARTLCSHDQDLHCDFKNASLVPRPKGRIYQDRSHTATLKHSNGCRK